MKIIEEPLAGVYVIQPTILTDTRGYFYEFYNHSVFENIENTPKSFVQDNISVSGYGVIRGLHFQRGIAAQAKLVSVLVGEVLDVIVDLRPESSTFKKSFSIHLSGDNKVQLFVPRGFAHGLSVLSEEAMFFYKCDNYYNKEAESGIRFDDVDLAIDWKIPAAKAIVSEKDLNLPSLNELNQ